MEEGRYFYGIIKENERKSFGLCGINACEEVYTISYQGICAVVSNVPIVDYSSMLKETLAMHLVRHQRVIEKVMEEFTIVPMKFGTIVENTDKINTILKNGYSKFNDILTRIHNKIELDIVATWSDLNSLLKEIGEEEEIKKIKDQISKKPADETLNEKIKIGYMVKASLDKKREEKEKEILDYLSKEALEFQRHDVMDDRMIMNAAFLIEKVKQERFDAAINKLNEKLQERVNFRCVGPLPPYSFSTIEIKEIDSKEIDEARKLLGLEEEAGFEKVKETYRSLAQKYHPDNDPHNRELRKNFEKITRAYKLLSTCYPNGNSKGCSKCEDIILVDVVRI